jgi:hypothetical protein
LNCACVSKGNIINIYSQYPYGVGLIGPIRGPSPRPIGKYSAVRGILVRVASCLSVLLRAGRGGVRRGLRYSDVIRGPWGFVWMWLIAFREILCITQNFRRHER